MPVVVLDDFAPASLIEAARATWPAPDDGRWFSYDNGKRVTTLQPNLPRSSQLLLDLMAKVDVAKLLCLQNPVFPDIDNLNGAGLHHMDAGIMLGTHKDSAKYPGRNWKREASAVLYLDTLQDSGALDFVNHSEAVQQRVEPKAGRLCLFATPNQLHRVNKCNSVRRSLCLFFWSVCKEGFTGAERAEFRPEV